MFDLPRRCRAAGLDSPRVMLGENWHNWHHAFELDCAASELEPYRRWDSTLLFIESCTALDLVTGRRRGIGCWALSDRKWLDEVHAAGCVS